MLAEYVLSENDSESSSRTAKICALMLKVAYSMLDKSVAEISDFLSDH